MDIFRESAFASLILSVVLEVEFVTVCPDSHREEGDRPCVGSASRAVALLVWSAASAGEGSGVLCALGFLQSPGTFPPVFA